LFSSGIFSAIFYEEISDVRPGPLHGCADRVGSILSLERASTCQHDDEYDQGSAFHSCLLWAGTIPKEEVGLETDGRNVNQQFTQHLQPKGTSDIGRQNVGLRRTSLGSEQQPCRNDSPTWISAGLRYVVGGLMIQSPATRNRRDRPSR
jgi:hypothetical protein